MPIFEYQCDQCRAEFEKLVFTGDKAEIQCPECKSTKISKKMSATGFTGGSQCGSDGPAGGASPFS